MSRSILKTRDRLKSRGNLKAWYSKGITEKSTFGRRKKIEKVEHYEHAGTGLSNCFIDFQPYIPFSARLGGNVGGYFCCDLYDG